MKKRIPTFCVAALILAISCGVEALAASFASVSGVWVATGARDWNGNGVIDAFEDFNGSGIPDAFEDFNGNGIPDAFEDFNGSGIPDAFESQFVDTSGSGIPDFFETVHPSKIQSSSHPNAHYWYNAVDYAAVWRAEDFPGVEGGWLWLVDANVETRLTLMNSQYEDTGVLSLDVVNNDHGVHWFHVCPLDFWFDPIPNAQTSFRFNVNTNRPLIASASHPDPDAATALANVTLSWTLADVSAGSIPRYYFAWNRMPNYVPGRGDSSTPAQSLIRPGQPSGTHYLHVVGEDRAGNLTGATHFRVNINEITGPVAGGGQVVRPENSVPAHGAVDVALDPLLTASAFDDADDPEALHEATRWEVVDHQNQLVWYSGISNGATTVQVPADVLSPNSLYQWRVSYQSDSGYWSAWSEPTSFETERGPDMPPVADFLATPTNGAVPLAVSFSDTSSGTVTGWEWDFTGDGVVDSTIQNPTHVYSATGVYTVSLTVSGPLGTDTLTREGYVTVREPAPSVDFSGNPLSGLSPLEVSFTATSSGGPVTEWAWDFDGDGTVDGTVQNPVHVYETPGTYTVRLTATGPGGSHVRTKTDYIHVYGLPEAAFSGSPVEGESPLTVTFTDESTGTITQRFWDFENNGVYDATNPVPPIQYTYTGGGSYSVRLTVVGPGGSNTLVRSGYISVERMPPVVGVATQQIYLTSIAEMATLDASDSMDPDGHDLFFSWREDDRNPQLGLLPVESESMATIHLYFPVPGRYRFHVRVSNGYNVSEEIRTITVYVPGRRGVVGFSPSAGMIRVPDAWIRVFASAADASNAVNPVDAMISDSRGRFALENLSPLSLDQGRTYFYRVDRPGFVSSGVKTMVVNPDPGIEGWQDEDIGRGTISEFVGLVRNPGGQVIEGANVSILAAVGVPMRTDSTGIDGRFRIANLPRGSWLMQLRADGYQPEVRDINVYMGMPEQVYTLSPAIEFGSITGRVVLAGTERPVANARIVLGTGAETQSDSQGRFAFNVLPVGTYIMTVTRSGYASHRIPMVRVQPGPNSVMVPIHFDGQGPSVSGEVTDQASGLPIPRASVEVLDSTGGLVVRSAVADIAGYYHLKDVPTGLQVIEYSAPGYVTHFATNNVESSVVAHKALARADGWTMPDPPASGVPYARVEQSLIYLSRMSQSVTLSAAGSSGANLRYLWREGGANPKLGLLEGDLEVQSSIEIGGFPLPGIYVFELQVKSGEHISPNAASITVFVPGLSGNVHASPSDGVEGLNLMLVRAYNNFNKALALAEDSSLIASVATSDGPAGDFAFDNLAPGQYWVTATPVGSSEYNVYRPVLKNVNHSSAARGMNINMPRSEFAFSGTIVDNSNGLPIENVRVVIAPGSESESYRTTTDASGAFHLASVPEGAHVALFLRDGYRARSEPVNIFGDTSREYSMTPSILGETASLSGRVTVNFQDIAVPVSYAEVILGAGLERTFTDLDGYYSFTNLPLGDYYGTVRKDLFRPRPIVDLGIFTLVAGQNTHDVTLTYRDHGPVVRGMAFNQNRQSLAGVVIRLLGPGESGPAATGTQVAQTDAGGIFYLAGLPPGNHTIEAVYPDGSTVQQGIRVGDVRASKLALRAPVMPTVLTYESWRDQYFTPQQIADPAISGEDATPAGDDMPNLMKYVFGHDPLTFVDGTGDTWVRSGHDGPRFGFRRVEGIADVRYWLRTTTNLVNGIWQDVEVAPTRVGPFAPGVDAVEVPVPDADDGHLFWRLRLQRDP